VTGVFDVAKEDGVGVTFAFGDKVYWDDGNDFAVATGEAGANKLLGKAVAAAADADTSVRVRCGRSDSMNRFRSFRLRTR
jgi:predicted RecA/RadA family phage recombinase